MISTLFLSSMRSKFTPRATVSQRVIILVLIIVIIVMFNEIKRYNYQVYWVTNTDGALSLSQLSPL